MVVSLDFVAVVVLSVVAVAEIDFEELVSGVIEEVESIVLGNWKLAFDEPVPVLALELVVHAWLALVRVAEPSNVLVVVESFGDSLPYASAYLVASCPASSVQFEPDSGLAYSALLQACHGLVLGHA